jgi:pyrimidine oxygenase
VGSLPLLIPIMDETDEAAQAKWDRYYAGADVQALAWMAGPGAINFNMGTLIGSYEAIAKQVDDLASIAGVKGIMFTVDDFEWGVKAFGERVMPLLRSA